MNWRTEYKIASKQDHDEIKAYLLDIKNSQELEIGARREQGEAIVELMGLMRNVCRILAVVVVDSDDRTVLKRHDCY